ncbi:MAG: Holliday junction branch migration protein RuvA [Fibrobacterales bacterium]
MIEHLTGILIDAAPTHLVISVGGTGYGLDVSLTTGSHYISVGDTVSIFTYLHVKEDQLHLFGFFTRQEREVFLALIGISGIGPKMAQRILSETTPGQLAHIVADEDIVALNKFKGVGKKTASLLLIHLKTSFAKMNLFEELTAIASVDSEAVMALVALGVKDSAAKKAIESAAKVLGKSATIQQLITEGLKRV